jgi:hypothetical protein
MPIDDRLVRIANGDPVPSKYSADHVKLPSGSD